MSIQSLPLTAIRIDADTQSRAAINDEAVADYELALIECATMPPVKVFFDGVSHILADGFHRYFAHQRVGFKEIECDVTAGTADDARLYAYGANQAHGLRRTNADKQKSVVGVLALRPEWSDRAIARHVGVSDRMVNGIRAASANLSQMHTRTVERGGKTYEQDVAGQKKAAAERAEKTIAQELQAQSSTGLPPAEPPSIVQQRAPGPVVSTGPEDGADSEGGDTDLDDMGDPLEDMRRDLEAAEARVAALAADDTKAQLLKSLQRAELAERRRDESMADSARAMQRADRYERLLARCGRAVGERDLDKVAPAVEAMARKARATA